MPEVAENYYQSDAWNNRRKEILTRDNYECRLCGSLMGLQVHHKSYQAFGSGQESDTDLISLCESCHPLATLSHRHQAYLRGGEGRNKINHASSLLLNKILAEIEHNEYLHEKFVQQKPQTNTNGSIQLTPEKEPSEAARSCAHAWFKFRPENEGEVTPMPGIFHSVAKRFDDEIISAFEKTYNISKLHASFFIKEFIQELEKEEECPIDRVGGLITNLCREVRDQVYQGLIQYGDIVPLPTINEDEPPEKEELGEEEEPELEPELELDLGIEEEPLTPQHVPFTDSSVATSNPIRSGMNSIKKIFSATSEEVEVDDYTITISQTAINLKLGINCVRDLVEKGELKSRRTGPGEYVSESSIEKYLKIRPLSARSVMSILDIPKKNDFYALCIAGRLKNVREEGRANYRVDRDSLRNYMREEEYSETQIALVDTARN
tara:strand:+ start:4039 stop:5346 length:1308 start_codon:yes stop_codon:yes gene_type:complete